MTKKGEGISKSYRTNFSDHYYSPTTMHTEPFSDTGMTNHPYWINVVHSPARSWGPALGNRVVTNPQVTRDNEASYAFGGRGVISPPLTPPSSSDIGSTARFTSPRSRQTDPVFTEVSGDDQPDSLWERVGARHAQESFPNGVTQPLDSHSASKESHSKEFLAIAPPREERKSKFTEEVDSNFEGPSFVPLWDFVQANHARSRPSNRPRRGSQGQRHSKSFIAIPPASSFCPSTNSLTYSEDIRFRNAAPTPTPTPTPASTLQPPPSLSRFPSTDTSYLSIGDSDPSSWDSLSTFPSWRLEWNFGDLFPPLGGGEREKLRTWFGKVVAVVKRGEDRKSKEEDKGKGAGSVAV